MARPSKYTEQLAGEICRLVEDGESVRAVCRRDDMPSQSMVYRWLDEHEAFREQYARAVDLRAEGKFEEAWEIADRATAENVQVARLQIDTIKWMTGKLAPKKYGDKQQVEHSGEVGIREWLSTAD